MCALWLSCISRGQNGGYFKSPLPFNQGSTGPCLSTNDMLFKYPRLQNHGSGKPLARSYPILLELQKVTPESIQQTQAGNIPETN